MNQVQDIENVIAGSGGCFRVGTQVQLEGGKTISIELLKEGDEILAFDESGAIHLAKVSKVHFHEDPQPILRVKFWGGEVFATPNHWVLNQYGNFAEIGRLTTHDALVDGMGHLRPIMGAEYVAHEPVWNLTVEPHHTFIANGVRVHNGGHRERYPVVAGSGGGGGKGGGGRAAVEDQDTLQSRAMVSLIDLLGEGQIGGLIDGAKSIYFNETPLMNSDGTMNFNGVTWDARTGSQDQTPMSGYSDVETPTVVNVKVRKAIPRVVTISNPNADAVRLVVTVPQLMSTDTSTGDMHGASVSFMYEISTNGGSYQPLSGPLTITGKTRSRYQRSYQFSLPKLASNGAQATTWNIKMTRTSDDSASSALVNDIWFDTYTEIVNSKLAYPNSALVGVTIDSSQFSSIPSRAYLVNGLYIKVPTNYDPVARTYSGVWDGTFKVAISNNPAWVLYDILTSSRYGLGQFLSASTIDKAKLYQIGKYCDESVPNGYGGYEPRFTVNTAIQTQAEAFRLITDLCSAFNGMSYWAGGMVNFMQDSPTDPSMVYTQANVIDGLFQYSGSSRKDRHSVVLVTWNDPTQNYKQMIEYVEDADLVAKYGVRKLEMVAFGCTSRGQAARAGRWVLYTEQYQSDMIQFSVGIDSAMVLPGDVIKIQDASRAGKRMGGRLVSATRTSATLDTPITLGSGLSVISIRMPDGTFVDRNIYESGSINPLTTVTWSNDLPDDPVSNAIWLISDLSLSPILARVVGVGQGENPGEFMITALEHNASKYDAIEKNLKLVTPTTSLISASGATQPSNIAVYEAPAQVAPGVMGINLDLSWEGQANSYEVMWRRDGKYQTNWITITTSTPAIELTNVRAGTYYFKIVAISMFGVRSAPVSTSYTTVGKTAAPGDVANFAIQSRTTDLLLTWDAVTDIQLLGYEVRVGNSWDTGSVITTRFAGTMLTHDQEQAGTYQYHIRSMGVDGSYSDNVTTATLVLNEPAAVSSFNCVQSGERVEFRWDANTEKDIVGYEIREGAAWTSSTFITQIRSTTYTMPTNSVVGDRTFWIKAVASPGIYSKTAVFSTTNVAKSADRNAILSSDEVAGGWLGSKFNASIIGGALQLDPGETYGEYTWGVSLPQKYRARNSITSTFDATVYDGTNWTTATFKWSSSEAQRPWVTQGDISTVNINYYISKYIGLPADAIEGFGLNGVTMGESGTRDAAQAIGVTYTNGRFLKGAMIGDFTRLNWNVPIPQVFNITFWAIPKTVSGSRVYWAGTTATGAQLLVGYDATASSFYLDDGTGQKLVVPYTIAVDDRVLIGIVQTSTTRRLYVGKINDVSASSSANYPPIGALTSIRLHQ